MHGKEERGKRKCAGTKIKKDEREEHSRPPCFWQRNTLLLLASATICHHCPQGPSSLNYYGFHGNNTTYQLRGELTKKSETQNQPRFWSFYGLVSRDGNPSEPVRSLGWISSCCNDTWESVRHGDDPCNTRRRSRGHNKERPQGWDRFYWTIPNTFGQYCKIKTLRLQKQMFSNHRSGFLLGCHVWRFSRVWSAFSHIYYP